MAEHRRRGGENFGAEGLAVAGDLLAVAVQRGRGSRVDRRSCDRAGAPAESAIRRPRRLTTITRPRTLSAETRTSSRRLERAARARAALTADAATTSAWLRGLAA